MTISTPPVGARVRHTTTYAEGLTITIEGHIVGLAGTEFSNPLLRQEHEGGISFISDPYGVTMEIEVLEPAPCYTNGGCSASLNCVWPKCRPWDDMDADEVLAAAKQMSGQIAEALGQRDEARAEVEQLRYERRLLGACRRHLDEIADPEGRYTVEAVKTAGDLAQRIVDEIGHSVTDEPALGPSFREEIHRLRAELEQVRAELAVVTGERDDALLLVQDGMPEPCQPIGCDNGHHLAGCVYAAADAGEAVSGRE